MNKCRKYISALLSLSLAAAALSGCSESTAADVSQQPAETSAASLLSAVSGTADYPDAYEIILSDSMTDVSAPGVTFENGILTITAAGDYLLSGTLSDGRICIEAPETDKVKLILNGVSVTSSDGPAIITRSADKTVIELAENSANILTDSSGYSLSEADASADSCIYSECDLKIKGSGSLSVNGNSGHGIHSKDDIDIEEGCIIVNSAKDGIKGKDSVEITGGDITVISAGDGINSDSTDEGKGYISVSGGSISVTSGGGASAAEKKSEGFFNFVDSELQSDSEIEASVSCKGIKAAWDITISGGIFALDCCDDAFHSNGNITVSGGEFNIKTGDDGFHADNTLTLSDGNCTVSESYEGIEGTEMILNGGNWNITASDDGVNVAGGSDGESENTRRQDMFAANENNNITIGGGFLYVNAEGDGIDSNGNIIMSGGEVYVDGPTNGGNGALDYNGTFEVTGGTVITAGSSQMAQTPSEQSSEYTLAVYFTSELEGGTVLSLKNSDGEVQAEYTPSKKFGCFTVTSPLLEAEDTVTLMKNGEELCTVQLSGKITSINENGEAAAPGFSNRGNGGKFFDNREKAPDMKGEQREKPADFEMKGEPPEMPEGFDMMNRPQTGDPGMETPDMNSGTVTEAALSAKTQTE